MMSIADCRIIMLPKVTDPRGNLTFIEGGRHVPFAIKRVHWIYDVPGGERRGGHACRELHEFLIAISGSFDVVVDDGERRQTFPLNRSSVGLYVPNLIWRHIENFSTNAVCVVLASTFYSDDDYIRDYRVFQRGAAV